LLGAWGDAGVEQATCSEQDAERETITFLEQYVPANTSPMCGNSICQDRRFLARCMPELERYFHYRNLDVSSIKELVNRWSPNLVSGFKKGSSHLALDDTRLGLAIGLGLIAIGAGGIKPCVSAHVGDQFGATNCHLLPRVFGWFYFSINLGAFVSSLLTPWLFGMYLVWLITQTQALDVIFPPVLLYISLFNLLFGNGFFIYVSALGAFKRRYYRLIPYAITVPFYWALMSIAAYKGLWQLIHNPFYWEKTQHGLSSFEHHDLKSAQD